MGQSQSDQEPAQESPTPSSREVVQRQAAKKSIQKTFELLRNQEHAEDAEDILCHEDDVKNTKWFKYGLVEVKNSVLIPEIQMNGLFATIDFNIGDVIVGYEGQIMQQKQTDRIQDTLYDIAFVFENKYDNQKYQNIRQKYVIRGYKSSEEWKFFPITEEYKKIKNEVDVAIPDSKHIQRYINVGCMVNDAHNTEKKSNADCLSVDRRYVPRYILDNNTNTMQSSQKYLKMIKPLYIVAKRNIKKGDEILWKYGKSYWDKIDSINK